jgi:hypothetical protein
MPKFVNPRATLETNIGIKGTLEHVAHKSSHMFGVMAGLVPAIHVLNALQRRKDVDARDKRGHDGGGTPTFPPANGLNRGCFASQRRAMLGSGWRAIPNCPTGSGICLCSRHPCGVMLR